jgi:hypothetical protein
VRSVTVIRVLNSIDAIGDHEYALFNTTMSTEEVEFIDEPGV